MPLICNTEDAPTLVRYTFDGEWSASNLAGLRQELIRAGQLTRKTCVLFDLRKATTFPTADDLKLALYAATADGVWPACRAFLVKTPLQHDVARQLQALLGPDSVINETFQEESAAMEWLSAFARRTHPIRA
jgi:hypothetical protein